jgi:hypothetical protein
VKRPTRAAREKTPGNGAAPRNGAARDPQTAPIWELLAGLGHGVPAEEWEKLPTDLARNVDHYLYGAPKRG